MRVNENGVFFFSPGIELVDRCLGETGKLERSMYLF